MADPAEITIVRRVAWMDTDAAGIYHWTTAFRFAEEAEAALHTALGIVGETFGLTPRLAVDASFHAALVFNDAVEIQLAVEELGRSSVRYRFAVRRDSEPAMSGSVVTCLVDPGTRRATPWPDALRHALGEGGVQTERAAGAR